MTTDKTTPMDHAKATIKELNVLMSEEWRVDEKQTNVESGVYITNGVVRLHVAHEAWRKNDKLHISLPWLHDDEGKMIEPYVSKDEVLPKGITRSDYGRANPPSIDVSPNTKRGYKHVASNINSRLYPAAFWFVKRCEYIKDQDARFKSAKTELAIRLQKAAPTAAKLQTKVHHTSDRSSEIKYPDELEIRLADHKEDGSYDIFRFGYGDVNASTDRVEINLKSLHPDLAVAVLETIEKFYNDNRGKNDPDPEEQAGIEADAAEFLAAQNG